MKGDGDGGKNMKKMRSDMKKMIGWKDRKVGNPTGESFFGILLRASISIVFDSFGGADCH